MRLLTVAFDSTDDFLRCYSNAYPTGALFCATRAEVSLSESLLVDISLPGLNNRPLIRGSVVSLVAGRGIWICLHPEDAPTVAFLTSHARGQIRDRHDRLHPRFPTVLPVVCRIDELSEAPLEAETECLTDLGVGGAFVRSTQPPPIGTRVNLTIGPDHRTRRTFTVDGRVAWVSADRDKPGFGVRFDRSGVHSAVPLRATVRRASEIGQPLGD